MSQDIHQASLLTATELLASQFLGCEMHLGGSRVNLQLLLSIFGMVSMKPCNLFRITVPRVLACIMHFSLIQELRDPLVAKSLLLIHPSKVTPKAMNWMDPKRWAVGRSFNAFWIAPVEDL